MTSQSSRMESAWAGETCMLDAGLQSSPAIEMETWSNHGVLVADDNEEVRSLVSLGLQQAGFTVWAATDGQEALEVYRREIDAIDVVLLDVCMPRMDGMQALTVMQELRPHIPCCFMSGGFGVYSEIQLLAQGAQAVVKKPFRIRELIRVIRTLVEGAGTWAAIPRHRVSVRPTMVLNHLSSQMRSAEHRRRN